MTKFEDAIKAVTPFNKQQSEVANVQRVSADEAARKSINDAGMAIFHPGGVKRFPTR